MPADHLHPAACLAKGALDQVGVVDALAMLGREQQVDQERVEVVDDAGDGRGVQGLPLGDKAARPPTGLGDGRLTVPARSRRRSPSSPPSPRLGRGWGPGDEVAAHVDQTPLAQAGRQRALDRRAQALAAVGDDQQRAAKPRSVRVGAPTAARPARGRSAAPRPTRTAPLRTDGLGRRYS